VARYLEQQMTTRQGILGSWSDRNFGVIYCKTGSQVENYFLHISHINYCEPDLPYIGCVVKFNQSDRPPKRKADLPWAVDAEVYEINPNHGQLNGDALRGKAGDL
jgi:hypothetical protein